jgi:uncharacterized membrane protein YbaN (DUF454 family)
MKNDPKRPTLCNVRNRLLTLVGTISLGLGILGIFLPLLPTTPFLLLAAACYSRSSRRFSNWLSGNRLFGKFIKDYQEGKGIPLKLKIFSILLLWITIGCSAAFAVQMLAVRAILVVIAFGVTIHILSIRTHRQL